MYGVITTVPAPVETYDRMHAELIKRAGPSVEGVGLLVHIGRATTDGFQIVQVSEIQGGLRPRQHRHCLSHDAGTGRQSRAPPSIEQATEALDVRGLVIPSGNILI